jgi:hypothetical protein
MLSLNSDSRVSDLDIVIFGAGNGNGERQHAEYEQYRAKQS